MYFGLLSDKSKVGVAESEKRVAAIFLLPVSPLEPPKRSFLPYSGSCGCLMADRRPKNVAPPIYGLGARPLKMFFMFYFTKNLQNEFSPKFVNRQLFASTLIPEILKEIYRAVLEKMGCKILGAWHIFEFAHLGAPFPHLTLADLGLMDPDKNSFCSGGKMKFLIFSFYEKSAK